MLVAAEEFPDTMFHCSSCKRECGDEFNVLARIKGEAGSLRHFCSLECARDWLGYGSERQTRASVSPRESSPPAGPAGSLFECPYCKQVSAPASTLVLTVGAGTGRHFCSTMCALAWLGLSREKRSGESGGRACESGGRAGNSANTKAAKAIENSGSTVAVSRSRQG